MKSGYYERYMLSDGKAPFSDNKLINEDEIPSTKFLDTYALEFLNLSEGILKKF